MTSDCSKRLHTAWINISLQWKISYNISLKIQVKMTKLCVCLVCNMILEDLKSLVQMIFMFKFDTSLAEDVGDRFESGKRWQVTKMDLWIHSYHSNLSKRQNIKTRNSQSHHRSLSSLVSRLFESVRKYVSLLKVKHMTRFKNRIEQIVDFRYHCCNCYSVTTAGPTCKSCQQHELSPTLLINIHVALMQPWCSLKN